HHPDLPLRRVAAAEGPQPRARAEGRPRGVGGARGGPQAPSRHAGTAPGLGGPPEPGPASPQPPAGTRARGGAPVRAAVVHNRRRRPGPSPERYGMGTVRRVVDALESSGHDVAVLDGDVTLLGELERFLGADPGYDEPDGLVFNMAYGIQGDCRYTHVPAMLE